MGDEPQNNRLKLAAEPPSIKQTLPPNRGRCRMGAWKAGGGLSGCARASQLCRGGAGTGERL